MRSPKSPKQLLSPQKRKSAAISYGRDKDVALFQFIVLFSELKSGEWPTFGYQHVYWEKAADLIQKTAGTSYKRTSKIYTLVRYLWTLTYTVAYMLLHC